MDKMDKWIGTVLDERYELQSVIGEGGMAVVYKAMDQRLHRYVAVKVMREEMAEDEEFERRFSAESQAVAKLSNPNIVAVYDVSDRDDLKYIVMELVDGITLKQYMDRRIVLSWQETLHFSKQIARALAHAHEKGIIHRDIKPQNVMLLRDGTVKVGDFGIAALENEVNEPAQDGSAIGSIHYIAPEQARGESPDARSDLYSLGVVMYEMLTGRHPFTGSTPGEIAVQHMNAEPTPIHEYVEDVPLELERITLKAMSAGIDSRYQSANELLADLDAFTQSVSRAQAEPPEEPEPEQKKEKPAPKPKDPVKEREKYRRRRRRAGRVSFLLGAFAAMASVLALAVFLWNYWLGEVFSPAERINLPNFVGSSYQALVEDARLNAVYSFQVVFVVDPEAQPGFVLAQDPVAGRSVMLSQDGIPVTLTVSSGVAMSQVPNVLNYDYRDASNILRQAGFQVEIVNAASEEVTEDYVIGTSPSPGEELDAGGTVAMTVSCGAQITFVTVPNLVGRTENEAISQIENSGLSYGGSEHAASDLPAGTVIAQSLDPFTQAEEHSRVIIQISAGPEG